MVNKFYSFAGIQSPAGKAFKIGFCIGQASTQRLLDTERVKSNLRKLQNPRADERLRHCIIETQIELTQGLDALVIFTIHQCTNLR